MNSKELFPQNSNNNIEEIEQLKKQIEKFTKELEELKKELEEINKKLEFYQNRAPLSDEDNKTYQELLNRKVNLEASIEELTQKIEELREKLED